MAWINVTVVLVYYNGYETCGALIQLVLIDFEFNDVVAFDV